MNYTVYEVLNFIMENDVKFVRLVFCDIFGRQKNISILPNELPAAFEDGVSLDANAIRGFGSVVKSDLLLFPIPSTLAVMPWRPGPGRVVRFYCEIRNPDKSEFSHDTRQVLRRTIERLEKHGYICNIGAECEFYLFKTDENGDPIMTPFDKGGYLDISPLDKGENVRREICLCLEEMGINPETSHHEQGPGQNEIDFKFADALSSADNLFTFKSVVKAIAARNGLYASFMPKPLLDSAGSGLHINVSLSQNGKNIFSNQIGVHSDVAESFIAGILSKTPEITLFLNPLANSYERFGKHEAPKYVSWSHQNRSQLVRIPAASGEKVRMELRSPDPSLNPYLAFALIISAGLEGIEKNYKLPPSVDEDLYTAPKSVTSKLTVLPKSLDEAISLAKNSEFVKSVIGDSLFERFIAEKETEAEAFNTAKDKERFYIEHYFETV